MYTKNIITTYVLIAIFSVIILPTYIILFIPPKFTDLIVENTKDEAIRVTNHLVSMFIQDETDLVNKEVLSALNKNDASIREEFSLSKFKLFLPTGEIVYSTDPDDIGKINERNYFFDIVAKGGAYTKLVKKDTRSLEGQIVRADVVETYVPIIKHDVFLGAFEIYYDITQTTEKLNKLLTQVYIVLLIVAISFLVVIAISTSRANCSLKERKAIEKKLRELSTTDDLTGLLNRRGFITMAEKQLNIAERSKRKLYFLYADVDNLKNINDTLGHEVGDKLIVEVANLLNKTFRKSDIIGRLGGDEFSILQVEIPQEADIRKTLSRLQENIDQFNADRGNQYELSLSVGTVEYDPNAPLSLDKLMSAADKMMYEAKNRKSNA